MQLFQHYILTRFNLPVFRGELRDGAMIKNLDPDYLRHRFEIFQKYTYPSIKNQTNQNFKWLVLMDAETPEEFRKLLSDMHTEYTNLTPCYFSLSDYKSKVTQEYIEKYNDYAAKVGLAPYESIEYSEMVQRVLSPIFIKDEISKFNLQTRFVVTSRIDNDDMFHPKMIETVQEFIVKEQEACLYNFSYGYQIHLKKRLLQLDYFPHNHYTTLVEDSSKLLQSVLYWDHSVLEKFAVYKEMKTTPLWVELVHELNVLNTFENSNNQKLLYRNIDDKLFPMLANFKINMVYTHLLDIKRTISTLKSKLVKQ